MSRDEELQAKGEDEAGTPTDGAPFRGRSKSAPPALWAAKKYGRQLRRMSDEFDSLLDKGVRKTDDQVWKTCWIQDTCWPASKKEKWKDGGPPSPPPPPQRIIYNLPFVSCRKWGRQRSTGQLNPCITLVAGGVISLVTRSWKERPVIMRATHIAPSRAGEAVFFPQWVRHRSELKTAIAAKTTIAFKTRPTRNVRSS